MIHDSRKLSDRSVVEADVCVLGAGAAGLSLALDCARRGARVSVVEEGGFNDAAGAPLAPSRAGGADARAWARRGLGGTTAVWGGRCRPLDEDDFEGWPFGARELAPFYPPAGALCGLKDEFGGDGGGADAFPAPGLRIGSYLYSAPERFGKRYRGDLEASERVHVYLRASALGASASGDPLQLSAVEADAEGKRLFFSARSFVVAMGTLESTRFLLLMGRTRRRAPGDAHGLLGRYFMEHPHVSYGAFEGGPGLPEDFFGYSRTPRGTVRSRFLSLDASVRRGRDIPAFSSSAEPAAGLAAERAADWLRAILPEKLRREWPYRLRDAAIAAHASTAGSKTRLFHRVEQRPQASNRVELSEARDRLGRNLLRLDWRFTASEWERFLEGLRLLRDCLDGSGLGRVILPENGSDWPSGTRPGAHPMGTTRMHASERYGVVDPNCRVHGAENLYVVSASVFPYAGFANPTLTVVALALRLAQRLA